MTLENGLKKEKEGHRLQAFPEVSRRYRPGAAV